VPEHKDLVMARGGEKGKKNLIQREMDYAGRIGTKGEVQEKEKDPALKKLTSG